MNQIKHETEVKMFLRVHQDWVLKNCWSIRISSIEAAEKVIRKENETNERKKQEKIDVIKDYKIIESIKEDCKNISWKSFMLHSMKL